MLALPYLPVAEDEKKKNGDDPKNDPPPDRPDEEVDIPKPSDPRPWPSGQEEGGRIFALLIAVDHYDRAGANLSGCVKDSLAVERYLRESVDRAGERLHLYLLRSPLASVVPDDLVLDAPAAASVQTGQPTRVKVVDAFLTFLKQAQKGDTAFVHFSGHGSFETLPEQLHHLGDEETKFRSETIMLRDSFAWNNAGSPVPPLRDKEMRWLLSQVAVSQPHIVLCMDCCNSAGNTRIMERETKVRFNDPPRDASRSGIDSYVFYQRDPAARQLLSSPAYQQFTLPEGRHVALYAGNSYELAKEHHFPEGKHGVFTYYLLQTLRACRGNLSYRDLTKLVRAKASQTVTRQSPQLHTHAAEDGNLLFLGGATLARDEAFTARAGDRPDRALLDAGSLHGIPTPSDGGAKTWVSVFPANSSLTEAQPLRGFLETVEPEKSVIAFADGAGYPADVPYMKAVITAMPLEKTRVSIETEIEEELVRPDEASGDEQHRRLADVKARLTKALTDHLHLQVVEGDATATAHFRLFAYVYQGQEKLRITAKDEVAAIVAPRFGFADEVLKAVLTDLTHIAKWERTLHLGDQKQPALIRPEDVSLEIIDQEGVVIENHNGELTLAAAADGVPHPRLKFKAVLNNHDQAPLYAALLHLSHDYSIKPGLLPNDAHLGKVEYMEGPVRISREQYAYYAGSHIIMDDRGNTNPEGLYLQFTVPEGRSEAVDHFKLIVSTSQFDPMYLWLQPLEMAGETRAGRPEATGLNALFEDVHTRAAGWATPAKAPAPKISDWWASTVTVRTVKPPKE